MKIIGKIIDKASGIYCIMNVLNSKRYIGRATKIGQRKRCHKSELYRGVSKEYHLQNSINKYGKDKFVFFVIEYCPINLLKEREQYWMDFYDTQNGNNGYNVRDADEYAPLTEEHKRKIGLGNKGKIRSKELRNRISISLTGKKHSLKTKLLMSKAHSGNKYALGCKHSLIANINKSIRQTGRKMSSITKLKISKAHKGKKLSEQHYNNLIIAQRLRRLRESLEG